MKLKQIVLLLAMLVLPALAFAQDEPPAAEQVNFLMYVAIAINAVLVPLLVQVVKPLYAKVPAFVKTIVPVVAGSLLTMAASYLSTALGYPVDLSALAEIFLGGVVGLGATMTYKMGAK